MAFEVIVSSYGQHSVIVLKDVTTNTFAEIYNFGALLNNFTSEHHGTAINIIDGFSSPAEAADKVTVFFKSAKLSPFACRVKNSKYKFGENHYLLSKFALRGTAIHGLIYNAVFEISEQFKDDEKASVKLSYVYENDMEGYPFKFKSEVEYELTTGNALTVKTTVTNLDEQLMPVVDGWHPYFTLGDSINDYQVEFQSKEMLEFDGDLVPTGKLIPYQEFGSIKNFGTNELDNCFTLNFAGCQPMCVIRHPKKKVQIEFHPDESYPYLQLYTPEHRKSIAVENLSGAPDAFNNGMGLKVLQPGESTIFTTKFITRSL
ncbi:aldose 1-epimerase [Segetibacter sp.]|jgi:aldose 1-epimerase|uniref:aldose 1-epimerase n=1 Tax=Segetibacter sp. TaxID=2231182 RepID=UPI00262B531D|nr:aldose 1-epimerase [Segetibacter sp.]MCW3082165.1 aldose 1-epimerase [Segetibacter sp.]